MGNIFFERFSELCKMHGETPNSVAKEIGASSGSVTAWKKGTEPRNATMTKIADYFDTTVDYLTGRTDDPENGDRFGLEDPAETQKEKAPAESGKRSGSNDILDEVDVAFYGDYKALSEENKETLRAMARLFRERQDKQE